MQSLRVVDGVKNNLINSVGNTQRHNSLDILQLRNKHYNSIKINIIHSTFAKVMKTIERTCAIAYSINLLGDKWSLLILRDVLMHKKTRFKEFIDSKEKIATNILANRLKFLVEEGFLELLDPDGFKKNKQYIGTDRALAALPIIMELYLFSIHSIKESVLNASQINIKKEILSDRKGFEEGTKENYLNFVRKLKNS